jgi:hypothetical protein
MTQRSTRPSVAPILPIACLSLAFVVLACAEEDDGGDSTSVGSPPPVSDGGDESDDDVTSSPADDGGGDGDGGDDGGGAIDCTFPNDISVCGCGNACNSDGPSYGLCSDCGAGGSGCVTEDIWCCSDAHCPAGTQCSTLSSSSFVGYHLCTDLPSCSTDDDCNFGEPCELGYCRDQD